MPRYAPAHIDTAPVPVHRRRFGLGLAVLWGVGGLASCGGLEPVAIHEAETNPAALYVALTLNAGAINLAVAAPYHTIQLTATPRNALGEAMSDLPAPTFRLASPGDSAVLRVTADGHVTALAVGSNLAVIAELVAPGPVRHADTAHINITADPPPVLDRLAIDPVPPDSAVWPLGTDNPPLLPFARLAPLPVLTPRALDGDGQPIPGLVVEFTSLDPARATVDRWTGLVKLLRPGPVRMVARSTAYGVTTADTALFKVTWPVEGLVFIEPSANAAGGFVPDEIRLLPGGILYWRTQRNDTVDITFDDPANVGPAPVSLCGLFQIIGALDICGVGNMTIGPDSPSASPNDFLRVRRFSVPGIYRYHSVRTGATGRVIVSDDLPH